MTPEVESTHIKLLSLSLDPAGAKTVGTAARIIREQSGEIERLTRDASFWKAERDAAVNHAVTYGPEIERLTARVNDAEADAVRLHKLATDRWAALLEMRCRDERNGSLPPAYRKIIDDALGCEQSTPQQQEGDGRG